MKLGLFNLMTLVDNPAGVPGVLADMRLMTRLAEEIGFDASWFAEHHFTNNSVSVSPLVMAAHMAACTSRIRLGTAVVVLPLYHPLRVAQEIALVDQLSDGRLVLGLGNGYQPYEFGRYGVDVAQRTPILLEAWDIVEQALTQGRVDHAGPHFTIPDTLVTVRPRQQPLPELFLASTNPEVLRRFGPLGAKPWVLVGWRGSPALALAADNARRAWHAAGLAAQPMQLAVQQYIHVTDDPAQAMRAAKRARIVGRMSGYLREPELRFKDGRLDAPPLPDEPPLETFRDNLLIGDAHHVAERLVAEIQRLDPAYYNCFFQFGDMPIAMARRSLESFARDVLPLVEKELGPLKRIGRAG